eukprot:TRINITY_DN3993_c0_g1_i2.p1 TRINITY_DN3993_c0_g1~~TRINITY_DN3993_c0_g1_i2.p1  ORF type:complete len:318 (-),score=62.64 TRINITY_DN3993_c0_g1_i2:22-945(-)
MDITVLQVKPGLGLPSLSPDSLKLLTLFKLAQIPHQTAYCSFSNHEKLPTMMEGSTLISHDTVFDYVRKHHMQPLDSSLGSDQVAEVHAFATMVEEYGKDVMHFFWWLDDANYEQVTKRAFTADLAWPYNHIWASRERNRVREVLEARGVASSDAVLERYRQCLEALNQKLGSQQYLMGNVPTSVDASVFAYLCTHLSVELPNNKIHDTLVQFPRLLHYVNNIRSTYFNNFKDIPAQSRLPKAAPKRVPVKEETKTTPEEKERSVAARNFGWLMLASIVGYVVFSGVFQFGGDEDEEDDEGEYEDEE